MRMLADQTTERLSHDIDGLRAALEELPVRSLLTEAIGKRFRDRIAVVSSFGAEAAVLLHLVATIDRGVPVVFIDTGRHFAETIRYRDALARQLGLTDVRSVGPTAVAIALLDPTQTLAALDPDACCGFRKVDPLNRALEGFDAWITGRRRDQTPDRAGLHLVEPDGPRVKINPLAAWSASDIDAYAVAARLPMHPLVSFGFRSIGCKPCTRAVAPGEDQRAGRWAGLAKTECGIHRPRSVTKGD